MLLALGWLGADCLLFLPSMESAFAASPSHYDSDGDGLIQITTVQQLNAVRYDLDGNGTVAGDDSALYAAAFPVASGGSVCQAGTTCTGYELMAALDLDTNSNGTADSGDTYWNDGAGWQPIGALGDGFTATFEGNGRSISNLFINRDTTTNVGLFGAVDEGGQIKNVSLVDLSVTGGGYVGGLVGHLRESTVSGSSTTGTVAGSSSRIGGLIGYGQNSIIEDCWSSANVTGTGGGWVGGLMGGLQGSGNEGGVKGVVRRSYATGTVSSDQNRIGGLVGNLYRQNNVPTMVVASYATGAVSGSSIVGGLVGRSNGEVKASYATGAVSGTTKAGGLIGDNRGTTPTNSYFDTDTSGQTHATQGKTTAELQAPTGYNTPASNIYANWNVDLDGDDTNDDPWDFGDGYQYPALKLDGTDSDTTATWQEFGSQLRTRPGLAVSSTATSATLTWAAPATTDYPGTPSVTYQVYRDGTAIGTAQTGVTYTDSGRATGFSHSYRVCVLLDGEPARCSHAATAPATISISIADATVAEGDSLSFTVSKTGTGAVTLAWSASFGGSNAAAAADLTSTRGAVSLTRSETSKTFTVATVEDAMDESNESFTVSLAVTSGSASLTDGTATGTITDDDESAGAPTSLTASAGSSEGEIDLSWTAPSDTGELNGTDPASITGYQYRRAESSAGLASASWTSAGTGTTFTVTGLTGGTTYYFNVRALNGVTPEGAASNEASAAAKTLPGISIADATGSEGGNVSFTVSNPRAAAATLGWTASIGDSDTATTGDLGTTTSGTVALTTSDTSKTFTVATVEDTSDEDDETFTVTITVTSGTATVTDGTAAGTITDDDESAGAPTSLTAATGSGDGEVDLSWTAPSDTGELNGTDPATITGYQYRKAQTSTGLASATWTSVGTGATFTVTGLTGGTTYYFQVRALNGVTPEGAASNEASAAAKALSSNADLSALTISQGTLSPGFSSTVTAYTATVANNVPSMTVTPTAADSNSTLTVNGTSVSSGSASGTIDLDIGANSIKVVVTAENATTKTYTITVTRSGPSISIADATGTEGGNVTFTVSKTGSGAVSLKWTASIEGSDTAATDDLGETTSSTVTFAASDTSKTFTVATKEDAKDENN